MAIKFLMIFLVSCLSIFGANKDLSSIKDLKAYVIEKTDINNKEIEKRYNIKLILPDLLMKTMEYPEINKGEIYLYKNEKRYVYLPIFDEVDEDNSDEDTNYFLNTMNFIVNKAKNDKKFRDNYSQGKVKKLILKGDIEIKLLKYKNIDGYLLPERIEVFNGNVKLGVLTFENIVVNSRLKKGEFQIKK